MKKILSVLLAALMLFGVFAIGASAMSIDDFLPAAAEDSGTSDLVKFPASVAAQGGGEQFEAEFAAISEELKVQYEARRAGSPACIAYRLLRDDEKAIVSGKTTKEFRDAYPAAINAEPITKAVADLDAFSNDKAAQKAEYEAGTLQQKLTSLYNTLTDAEIAVCEALASEFFTNDAMIFAKAFSNFAKFSVAYEHADLAKTEYDAFAKQVDDILTSEFFEKASKAQTDGDYKKAARLFDEAMRKLVKVMDEYGIDAGIKIESSFFSKLWNFIVKWIFFGWLWQK